MTAYEKGFDDGISAAIQLIQELMRTYWAGNYNEKPEHIISSLELIKTGGPSHYKWMRKNEKKCTPICDFCTNYDFNGDEEGTYIGKGYCREFEKAIDPDGGKDCPKFNCICGGE